MARTRGKKKTGENGKKVKAVPALKVKPSKRSKFSKKNNDIVHVPKNPVLGTPTAYLYGKQAISAKELQKRKRQSKNSKKKNNATSNFAPRNGTKKGKRIFVARFPVIGSKTKAAPWLNNNKKGLLGNGKDKKENRQRKLMNGAFSVNETAMKVLNSELEEFAAYVKLTELEIQAREHLVQEIQKSCKDVFGVEASQCQVFGSFAAQPVCIFESDIDLAIWGVVEPDNSSDDDMDKKPKAITKPKNNASLNNKKEQSHSNQKKQERVMKWKALIDNATNVIQQQAENSQGKNNEDPTKKGEMDEKPLFVLDRTGNASSLDLKERGTGSLDDPICYNSDAKEEEQEKQDEEEEDESDEKEKDGDFSPSESDESHSDNADKLEDFWSRKSGRLRSFTASDDGSSDSTGKEDERVDFNDIARGRPRGQSLVSLSSETTCSVEATMDESGLEVSFIVESNNKQTKRSKVVGPTGAIRGQVIKSLYRLRAKLNHLSISAAVRRNARIPIMNMVTRFGFECDIAIGGHNGTDTSSYATTQVSRFKSFPILVVFLKVLLTQQKLDKPFTGGLGSYCLYVLVASHIEQHLALGGADDPAEVLFTFFFRYGEVKHANTKINSSCRTPLSQHIVLQTEDGGSADLKNFYQVKNCVTVFESCWQRLRKRLNGNLNQKFSILQYMVDAEKLEQERSQCKDTVVRKLREVVDEKQLRKIESARKLREVEEMEGTKGPSVSNSTTTSSSPKLSKKQKKNALKFARLPRDVRELIGGVEKFVPVEDPPKKRKYSKKSGKKRKKQKMHH